MIRLWLVLFFLSLVSFPCFSQGLERNKLFKDFVLVYAGSASRPNWNVDDFLKLLRCDGTEKEDRAFFQSFVILETRTDTQKALAHPSPKRPASGPADYQDWIELLDRWFGAGGVLENLNVASRLAGGDKVDVWLGLPEPIVGGTFVFSSTGPVVVSSEEDKVRAINWFVERLFQRWLSAKFDRLNLIGFYWVDESLSNTKAILSPSMRFAKRRFSDLGFKGGLKYLWIPFWKSPDRDRWKDLGFDLAVFQPNYYVKNDVPFRRLNDAVDQAVIRDAGFEIEVDAKVFSDEWRARKAMSYIDVALSSSKSLSVIGVYHGNGALIQAGDDVWRTRYKPKLCDLISERH